MHSVMDASPLRDASIPSLGQLRDVNTSEHTSNGNSWLGQCSSPLKQIAGAKVGSCGDIVLWIPRLVLPEDEHDVHDNRGLYDVCNGACNAKGYFAANKCVVDGQVVRNSVEDGPQGVEPGEDRLLGGSVFWYQGEHFAIGCEVNYGYKKRDCEEGEVDPYVFQGCKYVKSLGSAFGCGFEFEDFAGDGCFEGVVPGLRRWQAWGKQWQCIAGRFGSRKKYEYNKNIEQHTQLCKPCSLFMTIYGVLVNRQSIVALYATKLLPQFRKK